MNYSPWISAIALFFLGFSARADGQRALATARQLVLDQAAVSFNALWLLNPGQFEGTVDFDTLLVLPGGITLLRGAISDLSHPNPYIVAILATPERPLRLGGFSETELRALSAHLSQPIQDLNAARTLARVLITAADPNGAGEVVVPGEGEIAPADVADWVTKLPPGWPGDTSFTVDSETVFVRRTALSHQTWGSYGKPWLPIVYGFLLDRRGSLLAWEQHLGPILKTP